MPEDRLFISYSSKNSEQVNVIVAHLLERGLTVWFDQHQIRTADNIVQQIEAGLQDWKYFLLFASHSYFESNWATAEYRAALYAALNTNERKVIIIRLDDTQLPPLLALSRYITFTTPKAVAEEIATIVNQTDISQIGNRLPISNHLASTRTVDKSVAWESIQDHVLYAILDQLFGRLEELRQQPGPQAEFKIEIRAGFIVTLYPSNVLLNNEGLMADLKSEWEIFQVTKSLANKLIKKIREGGLGIFEAPFEIQLEKKQREMAESRLRLLTQISALSPVVRIQQ